MLVAYDNSGYVTAGFLRGQRLYKKSGQVAQQTHVRYVSLSVHL